MQDMLAAVERLLSAPRGWQVFAITLAAYVLAAWLSLLLTLPPGIASPLFPAAGIALAAVLVWGRPALLAVWLGSMAANLWHAASLAPLGPADWAITAGIGTGAALQAGAGAWLLRRFVGTPLLLAEPAQLWRFVALGALLASCISASVGLAVLSLAGKVDAAQALAHWGAWWIGDSLGVLIFAPLTLTLTLIGHPREEWAPRRWPMAMPLLVVTLLLGLGIRQVVQIDAQRQRQSFEREANSAANAVQARLQQPLHALEAMRGLVDEMPELDRAAFRRASAPWLRESPGLRALGWNQRVARSDIAAFESRERATLPSFQVFDRRDAGAAQPETDVQVIRFIEPLNDNVAALGVNVQSIPLARAAVALAARSGAPAVSAGFGLTQGGVGVVVYQAVYRGQPTNAAERVAAQRGLVFATLQLDVLLRGASSQLRTPLQLCLVDNDAPSGARILAGPPGCDHLSPFTPLHTVPVAIGGRQWDLRVYSNAALAPTAGGIWPFALVGLLGAALLGALLLTVTGRARRIEAAVARRTDELQQRSAELQAEVAERQRATTALRESQQRLRNILDHVPIGVAYTDAGGRIREANPKLREMLGLTDFYRNGSPIADLIHPDDREAEAQARQRLLTGDVPMARWPLRWLTTQKRTLWAQVGVSVLRDAQGEARRLVWVVEDITEHRALEEAQRARRGAEAANQAKSDFLSRMSHELRTPLNAMLGFTQLLELDRRQPMAAHQLEWTGQIRQAGWHLLHMINDTLDLARIESGHVDLDPRALDLADVVADAVALLAHNAEHRGIRIQVQLRPDARHVLGDATRLKQILTNLLSNAVKYNVEGGQVHVSSRIADDGRVAVEVQDSGAGMDADQVAQLFQPFNRLGREGGPVEGTGIGLVISLRLAELMSGTLYAQSSPGSGSTFTVELPRASAAAPPLLRTPADDGDSGLGDAHYRQRVVHYIEDNEINAEVMRGILALRPQINFVTSALGLDGLATIRARRPSVILLDMHLPDIDGLELLRHLKADADTADIPVVVVSADATESRIAAAMTAGATHYLTKPVNVQQFLTALDEILERLDTLFG